MNNTVDKKYMDIAIELAKNGKYRTHPNPLVGAVIVKNDKIKSIFLKKVDFLHIDPEFRWSTIQLCLIC